MNTAQVQKIGDLVAGATEFVAGWVKDQLGPGCDFGPCQAVGVMRDGRLIAGVVYSNLRKHLDGTPHSCEVTVASTDPRWCSRRHLEALFGYPFDVLGCRYVWSMIERRNKHARRFTKRVGWREVGILTEGALDGGDMVFYQMNRKDCRWIDADRR